MDDQVNQGADALTPYINDITSRPTQAITNMILKTEKLLGDQVDYRVRLEARYRQRLDQIDFKYRPLVQSINDELEYRRKELDTLTQKLAETRRQELDDITQAKAEWENQDSAQAKLIEAERRMVEHLKS